MQSVSFCLRQEVLRQHLTRRRGGSEWRRLDQLQVKIKTFWVGYTWEANSYLNKGGSFPSHRWSQQIFFPDIYTCYIYIYFFFLSLYFLSLWTKISMCLLIRRSVHPSISPSPYLPFHTYPFIYLHTHPYIYSSSHPSTIHLSIKHTLSTSHVPWVVLDAGF